LSPAETVTSVKLVPPAANALLRAESRSNRVAAIERKALATKAEIFFDERAATNPALRSPGARVFSLGLMEFAKTSDGRRVVDLIKDVNKEEFTSGLFYGV
jgi:hypothetical protein